MNNPLVSICSITYNHAPFIRQCLDGFLMQQCNFPIEIIINDDCSTDGTTEIIREYAVKHPDKIFPIFHEENQWSKGERGMFQKFVFPKARGKYIALCEGDDYWTDPLKLQKQVEFLESHPECSLCCHAVNLESERIEIGNPYIKNEIKSTYFELEALAVPTCSVLTRKVCVDLVPTHPNFDVADVVIWFTCSQKGYFYNLSEKMATYQLHSGSWSVDSRRESVLGVYKHMRHWFAMYELFSGGKEREVIRRFLAKNIFNYQRVSYRKNIFISLFYLLKALMYCRREYFNHISLASEIRILKRFASFCSRV